MTAQLKITPKPSKLIRRFAPAYFNRGNIQVLIEQPENGCEDFRKALDLGQNKSA
jgi:hypothetical protein